MGTLLLSSYGIELSVDSGRFIVKDGRDLWKEPTEMVGIMEELGVDLDPRGNVKIYSKHMKNIEGVFAVSDLRKWQSMVVWAIQEGTSAACSLNHWLMS
jgi:NADPH-dependent glutamate synthase beta subunit-like oxidoreductase